jgi:transcriptional regulator GlxA family with amidase domain
MKTRFWTLHWVFLSLSLLLTVSAIVWKSSTVKAAVASPRTASAHKLTPPADGTPIPVAFVLTDGATMIDFTGPWEVFQDAGGPDGVEHFRLFTVGASKNPIHTSGGMTVIPDYSFADAPAARIVVVPAQRGDPALADWLRHRDKEAEVLMSVCTGAFQLGKAGLLDGKQATTHHNFYGQFEKSFPKATLMKGRRYVQSDDVIYTAGGLTSGIDLAMHIVEEYLGRDAAQRTADYMEYQGMGWKN